MPYHQLNANVLRPGDVILEAGAGMVAWLIKRFDRGKLSTSGKVFYHVLLYTGMQFVTEATREGVRSFDAGRIITKNPSDFLVLRHPKLSGETTISPDLERSFRFVMQDVQNEWYNLRGAISTKLSFIRRNKSAVDNSYFCSQLVAEFFERIGLKIFKDTICPELITPSMFISDNCILQPVNDDCFVILPDHPGWRYALRRYYLIKTEPFAIQQRTHKLARKMIKLFGPRVEGLLKKIGKEQTIRTPSDLYVALMLPDLPEADLISDQLVEFLEMNGLDLEIAVQTEMKKKAFEELASVVGKPWWKAMLVRWLCRSIKGSKQFIPVDLPLRFSSTGI